MGQGVVVTARDGAYHVTRLLGRPCAPSTIRRWAHEGRIQRVKTSLYGTAVYTLADILTTAKETARITTTYC